MHEEYKVKEIEDNIYLAYKPKGISSFQFIQKLKKEIGAKKIGHAGTLDPQAEGLMIVASDSSTKRIGNFLKLDKCYEAEILIGISTDTLDMEGRVVKEKKIKDVDANLVKKTIESLKGELLLYVPLYSAVKVKGKELYKYARAQEEVKLPQKRMNVLKSEFVSLKRYNGGFLVKANFCVSSGTYIRSLVDEFSKRINIPATLFSLKRTSIGNFSLNDI